jgi:hypothetical protein
VQDLDRVRDAVRQDAMVRQRATRAHEETTASQVVTAHQCRLGRFHGSPCSRRKAGPAYPPNASSNDPRRGTSNGMTVILQHRSQS